ncbi:RNA polymerase sigma factor [Arsenicibacter rosenii]|uniref:RNA polymerase subunit sigma-70 n=1 Tax=Arsenicibacter rosenii TaxID=1750698 RepID=A0A1S2VLW2_9BACT|nr:sigma-70 family RNA polymerase sigma factor [Arsenicibacter rosenii]OIN59744.1 hypothetical protein BLX24_07745 [Arsenicibacter rosenii]
MKQSSLRLATDEALVKLYLNTTQERYFQPLYQRHYGLVLRHCLAFTKDPDLAQDFAQTVFEKALINLHTFKHKSRFSTWLYVLARNYCLSQQRRHKPFRFVALDDYLITLAEPAPVADYPFDEFFRILHSLPDLEKEILRLRYEHNLSIPLIAEQVNMQPSAVKMRLKRCRDKLRKQIDGFPS